MCLVAALGFACPVHAAPVQWTVESGGNGHWYDVVSTPTGIAWTAARDAAVQMGWQLASVTSHEENEFIFSLVDDANYWWNNFGPWLGGYQVDKNSEATGSWAWVDGEPWSFTAWSAGQPDNYLNKEDYLQYYLPSAGRDSTWNDWENQPPHEAPVAYVIESVVPEPSATLLLAFGSLAAWLLRRS